MKLKTILTEQVEALKTLLNPTELAKLSTLLGSKIEKAKQSQQKKELLDIIKQGKEILFICEKTDVTKDFKQRAELIEIANTMVALAEEEVSLL